MNKYPGPLGGGLEVSYPLSLPAGSASQKLNSSAVIPASSLFEPRLEMNVGASLLEGGHHPGAQSH